MTGRAVADRLAAAFPDLPARSRQRILSRSLANAARVENERRAIGVDAAVDPARLCSRLELDGWGRIAEAEHAGHGVALLSAGLGIFDLLPVVLRLYKGGIETLDSIAARADRADAGSSDPPRLLARLDRPSRARATDVEFLGSPFSASTLAAQKVLDWRCPALPVFAFLEGRRKLRVVVRPRIPVEKALDANALTQRFLTAVETEILARPDQYSWIGVEEPSGSVR